MKDLNQGLFDFIAKSPTCFQAVETSAEMLEQAGFEKLTEASAWELKAGNGYYVTRNQSSLIAFRMPERLESCMIGAAIQTLPASGSRTMPRWRRRATVSWMPINTAA